MISYKFLLVLGLFLVQTDLAQAFGWNWVWPFTTTTTTSGSGSTSSGSSSSAASGSNYTISIGNRENTFANLTDYGTQITNLQINLARFNGTALSGSTSEHLISEVIYAVTEEYRNTSEAVVSERLAWMNETIGEAYRFANQLRRRDIPSLLQLFADDVQANVRKLNQTVRSCLGRERIADGMIQSVFNRSQNDCLEARIRHMLELRELAKSNLTNYLASSDEVEDRLEECAELEDGYDEGMSDWYQVACISSVLLGIQTETLKLRFTVNQLTQEADSVLNQSKANLLECVTDLASYALDASLGLRNWISVCNARR